MWSLGKGRVEVIRVAVEERTCYAFPLVIFFNIFFVFGGTRRGPSRLVSWFPTSELQHPSERFGQLQN